MFFFGQHIHLLITTIIFFLLICPCQLYKYLLFDIVEFLFWFDSFALFLYSFILFLLWCSKQQLSRFDDSDHNNTLMNQYSLCDQNKKWITPHIHTTRMHTKQPQREKRLSSMSHVFLKATTCFECIPTLMNV